MNHKGLYAKYKEKLKEKIVLITHFDIFPDDKFDDDEYSKKFEKWKRNNLLNA